MGKVGTALSTSLDGFIAGSEGGSGGLHDWLTAGGIPSSTTPAFEMAKLNAEFFDEGVLSTGAVVAGRRTYDISDGWGGRGPIQGLPLFVLTHQPPQQVPQGNPPYTFVAEGIEAAIEKAQVAANGKNVHLMGASVVQQSIRSGLLDELIISLVPVVLSNGVRLLDGLDNVNVHFEIVQVLDAPGVTHLTYRVSQRQA